MKLKPYICIENHFYEDRITFTKGNIYTPLEIYDNNIQFIDDEGDHWSFSKDIIHYHLKIIQFKYGK
jgi:hypothetical protein